MKVLIGVKSKVHPWIRLNRVVRDIPSNYILGGVDVPNMRQDVLAAMRRAGLRCHCIRCREVGDIGGLNQNLDIREPRESRGQRRNNRELGPIEAARAALRRRSNREGVLVFAGVLVARIVYCSNFSWFSTGPSLIRTPSCVRQAYPQNL